MGFPEGWQGCSEELPCHPEENPVHPNSLFCIGPPKIHGWIRIDLPKVHGRICIGLQKVHGRFRIGPPQVSHAIFPH